LCASADNGTALRDPLSTPASVTIAGERSQLVGVAQAGERLLAIGRRGLILASSDAGASWTQVASPVSADLTSITFSAPKNGWITGHDAVVLRTRDGGATWERKLDGAAALKLLLATYGTGGSHPDPVMAQDAERAAAQSATAGVLPYPLLAAWFANADEGFVGGAFGLLLHTTDGGATWTPWLERAENTKMNHIYAIGGSLDALYLAGEQGLLRRRGAGQEGFVTVKTPYEGTFFGVHAANGVTVAYGLRGNAWMAQEDGKGAASTWRKLDTGTSTNIVAAVGGNGAGALVLVSQSGELIAVGADGAVQRLAAKRSGEVYGAAALGMQLVTTGLSGARAQSVAALSAP
jgi:photosystem II stability/assembly factor-like uncharacterized protein